MKGVIVAIDVCDTLVKGNTTFHFLDVLFQDDKRYTFFKKVKKNYLVRILLKILFKLKFDINRRVAIKFLAGYTRDDLLGKADVFVREEFKFKKDVLNVIEYCKGNNIPVYLVSASLDFIVESISKFLDVNWYASSLEYSQGVCNGRINQDLLFSKAKIIQGIESQPNCDSLIFISDNIEDLKILSDLNYGFGYYSKKNSRLFTRNKITAFDTEHIINLLKSMQ
ncbi:HAD family hydrolase [Cedecea sp. NFIX57]|uniref:HAD family hydrolase n=1 Tax=Cedecea sp. NFIX57 TaxID=1566286 RepID=UPI000A0B004D|nr:HAD family hydrolase [Cedecea sp. NFIX57]SMG26003.1 Phosphoserine phosphatase [Cedecea sp. NFIX57]